MDGKTTFKMISPNSARKKSYDDWVRIPIHVFAVDLISKKGLDAASLKMLRCQGSGGPFVVCTCSPLPYIFPIPITTIILLLLLLLLPVLTENTGTVQRRARLNFE